jgi:hypothetical protein
VAVQARRFELEQLQVEQERHIKELQVHATKELEEQRREVALQQVAMAEQLEEVQVQAAQLEEREQQVKQLTAQYGSAAAIAEREIQLRQREEELEARAAQASPHTALALLGVVPAFNALDQPPVTQQLSAHANARRWQKSRPRPPPADCPHRSQRAQQPSLMWRPERGSLLIGKLLCKSGRML